jgi:hypothetical protein
MPRELPLSRADEPIQSHCEPNQNAVGKLNVGVEAEGRMRCNEAFGASASCLNRCNSKAIARQLWETKLREDVAAARCPLPDTEPFKLTAA